IIAYPDPDVRLAISRAVAVETSRGWRIAKEKQVHKIDVVVALAMAAHAAVSRQWDEAPTSFHPPIFGGTPRYVPGSDAVVGEVFVPTFTGCNPAASAAPAVS